MIGVKVGRRRRRKKKIFFCCSAGKCAKQTSVPLIGNESAGPGAVCPIRAAVELLSSPS